MKRRLNFNISLKEFKELDDEFIIKNATLIAPGIWTDSLSKKPCFYKKEILKKFANNWKSTVLTINHSFKVEDIIGYITNIRWSERDEAIVGDLHIFPITTKARDLIKEIKLSAKNKEFPRLGVSVDILTKDVWNQRDHVREAIYIEFWGATIGYNPACKRCYIT